MKAAVLRKTQVLLIVALALSVLPLGACNSIGAQTDEQTQLFTRQVMVRFSGTDVPVWSGVLQGAEGEEIQVGQRHSEIPCIDQDNFPGEISFVTEPIRHTVRICREDTEVFFGTADDFSLFIPETDGEYQAEIHTEYETGLFSGTCEYRFIIRYETPVSFALSSDRVGTGDVLLLTGKNLRSREISVRLDYPYEPHLTFGRGGRCLSLIPVNHLRISGEYRAVIDYQGEQWVLTYTVREADYEEQHLYVPEDTYNSTVGNTQAQEEYARILIPLFESFDDEKYWNGLFLQPVEGQITTEYGLKRYTNDNPTPTRHAGIDIAAALGTPVAAANTGKVLFAGTLTMTGNTVLIEHGLGLHTLYLHMNSLQCQTGQTVMKGDIVGTVGMTGYATGPHLHFEVMVGFQSLNPWYAFDGTAGFYQLQEIY